MILDIPGHRDPMRYINYDASEAWRYVLSMGGARWNDSLNRNTLIVWLHSTYTVMETAVFIKNHGTCVYCLQVVRIQTDNRLRKIHN